MNNMCRSKKFLQIILKGKKSSILLFFTQHLWLLSSIPQGRLINPFNIYFIYKYKVSIKICNSTGFSKGQY